MNMVSDISLAPIIQPIVGSAADLEHLGDQIAELSAHLDAAGARLLDLIREFDARGGWNTGFRSCAAWLSWRVGLDRGAARERDVASFSPSALAVAPWSWRYGSCGFTRLLRAGSLAHPGGPSLSLRQRRRRFQPPESLFTPLDAGSAVLMLSLRPGPAAGGVCAARLLREARFGPLGRRGVPAGPGLRSSTMASSSLRWRSSASCCSLTRQLSSRMSM